MRTMSARRGQGWLTFAAGSAVAAVSATVAAIEVSDPIVVWLFASLLWLSCLVGVGQYFAGELSREVISAGFQGAGAVVFMYLAITTGAWWCWLFPVILWGHCVVHVAIFVHRLR